MNKEKHFIEKLKEYAVEQGAKTALTCFDSEGKAESVSYAEFYRNIFRMKNGLEEAGLKSGQCCMLAYEDSEIDYITAILAISVCGAIAVPFKVDFNDDDLNNSRYIAENSEASLIVAGNSYRYLNEVFKDVPIVNIKDCYSDDESESNIAYNEHMIILYTSGSTDRPKGVPYKEESICCIAENYSKVNGRTKDSVTMCCLPLNHTFALISMVLTSVWKGGHTVLVAPKVFALNPFIWLEKVSAYKVTHTASPNIMLSMIADATVNSEYRKDIDVSSLEAVALGAEFIQPGTVAKFTNALKHYGFGENRITVNYGLTETYAAVTATKFNAALHTETVDGKQVYPTGYVLEGNSMLIIDPETEEVIEDGRIGEICLNGLSVFDGYWKLNSQESFIEKDGKKYFRTGDLGFTRENDGTELYVYGRIKEIINIKGENYSPYFIESATDKILSAYGKSVAVSVPKNDTETLVIFVEQAEEISEATKKQLFEEIKTYLVKRLSVAPEVIVFSKAGSFLRTQSGKLRRTKMKNLYIEGKWEGTEINAEAEHNSDVKLLITNFIKRYSDNADFDGSASFVSLGISSLLSQLLIAEISDRYNVELSLADINKYYSVDLLSEHIKALTNSKENTKTEKTEETISEVPLTDVQQAYLTGRNPEIEWGGVPCQCYIERDIENLDIEKFRSAVKKLTERHEMLRTVIMPDFTQRVLDDWTPEVEVQNACGESGNAILERTRKEMSENMLPSDEPLFKIVVSETDNNIFRVHIQIDMICCDAMSILIFWSDLKKIYDNEKLGELSMTFAEYQAHENDPEKKEADRKYWREKLKDFPSAPELPWNAKADKVSTGSFSRHKITIDKEKWSKFEKLTEELGITPTTAMLTLFSETLSAFGAGAEFALSLTTLGRKPVNKSIYNVIGDFTKVMLLAVKCRRKSLLENALSIQENMKKDLEHTDFTSIDIAREFRTESSVYPVVFTSFLGMEKITGETTPFSDKSYSQSSTPQVLLDNQILIADEGIMICWDAVEKAFADGMLDKMFEAYTMLIEKAFNKDFWLSELRDLRTEHDKEVQNKANSTADETIPIMTLADGFIEQAEKHPERRAVVHKGVTYTYGELKKRADQISRLLEENHIETGDRVMIQMDKSFDLIAAIMGTVQYGAVYLPMPHDQPQSRQSDIYKKAQAKCMITDNPEEIAEEIPVLTMKDADTKDGKWNRNKISPDQLAYIIYTSGSTGTPKGVAIQHRCAMNTIVAVNRYLNLGEDDCLIGLSSVSFDLSVYDIFGAFTAGAGLLVPTEAERIDPACWITLCKENNVTAWNTVPAIMDILLDYCIAMDKVPAGLNIKNVILSGDWIPMDLFGKLSKVIPQAKLTSMGGATEASIWSNYYPVSRIEDKWVSIPYGYPLPNQIFHILDDFNRLCPCGVSGKLCIGGKGVAYGYYNEKELTEKAFIMHEDTGERLYDTGDYGRYDEDGCLIFMGRKDTQVKINGYRIELGEIQSALDKIGYESNTVIVSDEGNSGKKLIGFVKTDKEINESELKQLVSQYLPNYFVPDRVIAVSDMPVTANGKIDKKSLLSQYKNFSKNHSGKQSDNTAMTDSDNAVLELLRKELNIPELSISDSLTGWGITSLSLIRLAGQLETAFGHRDNINNIIRYRTAEDFINYYRNTSIDDVQKKIDEQNEENFRNAMEFAKNDPLYNHPVMQSIMEELQEINISSGDLLADLGLSSLSVIRIANKLESEYGCRPSIHDMLEYKKISDLIDFYEREGNRENTDTTQEDNAYDEELAKLPPVIRCICEVLNIRDIDENADLTELGLSSLSVIRIANKLESEYGCRPSVHDMLRYKKVKDIMDFYDNMEETEETEEIDNNREEELAKLPPVLRCVCEVLNLSTVDINDSFVNLGISSLEMIRIANKLEALYGKRPSVQELAEQTSLKQLVDFYEGMEIRNQEETQEDIDRKTAVNLYNLCRDSDIILWPENGKLRFKAPKGAITPEIKQQLSENKEIILNYLSENDSVTSQDLTPLQMAYVIGRQNQYVLGDITAHYYVEYRAENLDLDALQDAINELIIKNEILRTIITPEGRMNVYRMNPGYTVEVVGCDENNIPERNLREEMKDHQFELGKWPMFDVKVTKYSEEESIVHIGIDCLILDGWSINMFLSQFIKAYTGNPVEVTDYTFRLYLEEERRWLRNKQYHRESQKYWTEQIDRLPPAPHLPLKNRLEDIKKPSFRRKKFFMNEQRTFAFFQRMKKYNLTPSIVLCTAYMMSLSKYSENPDVTLNLTMFNRQPVHPDVQQVLGDFTNIALIGYHSSDEKRGFLKHTEGVSKELWNAIEYRSFNVINLLGQLAEKYDDVIAAPYVFTSLLDKEGEKGGDIMKKAGFTEIFAQTQTPQVVLDHQLYLADGKLLLVLDYVEQAFDDEMLSAMFKDYTDRVEALADNENWEEVYD